jgi:flagellar hook-associated protein 2
MAGIQAPGVGSNLDVNSIVTQLIAAEKAPAEKRLANEEALVQARLSTLGIVKSSFADFQTSIRSLASVSAFQSKTASVANESLFSATVSSAAKAGQYSVEVEALAQAQKLVTKTFTNSTATVGTGTLHIKFGSYDSQSNQFQENTDKQAVDIVIGNDKSSLQGIRDAINAAKTGVTASLLNDGSGERLVLSSESGQKNGLQITVSDNDGNHTNDSGLSQLAFDPTTTVGSGKNMEQTLVPKDAIVWVDGIKVTRPTNSVTGIMSGVTLDLKQIAPGSPTTFSVSENKSSIKESVQGFVDSFNALKQVLNKATKYDAEQKKGSLLTGDSAIRGMNTQMQRIMGEMVAGVSGDIKSLADIGITSARDGTLQLDAGKLDKALTNNIDQFAAIFSTTGRTTDSLISYVKAGADTKVGEYAVSVTQLATQASYSNPIGANPFLVDSNNDTFKLKVDGVESGLITLTQNSYSTGEQLALEIQTQINADSVLSENDRSVIVEYASGNLSIRSSRYGSDSAIAVTQIESTSSNIGLTIKSGTPGLNVAGTIGGVAATGLGTVLTGSGDAEGLQIDVAGGVVGTRGTVEFSNGVAQQLNALIDNFLGNNGALTQRINDFNERATSITEKRTKLNDRLTNLETRLRAQFLSMDLMVGQMRATSDSLTSQLAGLPYSNSN